MREDRGFYQKEKATIECPVCRRQVEFLLGDDVDGGRRGCEACWKPPVTPQRISKQTGEEAQPIEEELNERTI